MDWTEGFNPYQIYMPTGSHSFPCSESSLSLSAMSTPMQSPNFPPGFSLGDANLDKKKNRRYKTPSPQLLRRRRSAANERERKRMNTLNVAYDKLRTVLPVLDTGKKLSKFETLQLAQKYIECLAGILKDQPTEQTKKSSKCVFKPEPHC
ncbi:unnamed protein product [Caenorhabditis auriculariae]|uniref:BHLH domain-containing protein n=1 Tax=Caenorhabditis auriculariae TaxID=2777116 RepID=A0A8S1GXD8_9PELO|nr:unnamed protein product [Caenorhabditis auriculariae]